MPTEVRVESPGWVATWRASGFAAAVRGAKRMWHDAHDRDDLPRLFTVSIWSRGKTPKVVVQGQFPTWDDLLAMKDRWR